MGSMKTLHRYRESFTTSHHLPCSTHYHGHVVRVMVESFLVCDTAVRDVLSEFHERALGEMLPGGDATQENLAAYLHERLAGFSVQAIDVWFDDTGVGVRLEW